MMCLLLQVLVSALDPAPPLRVRDLRDDQLCGGVGVATAHSQVTLRKAVQDLSSQLAHSHTSIRVNLLMNNSKSSEAD